MSASTGTTPSLSLVPTLHRQPQRRGAAMFGAPTARTTGLTTAGQTAGTAGAGTETTVVAATTDGIPWR